MCLDWLLEEAAVGKMLVVVDTKSKDDDKEIALYVV